MAETSAFFLQHLSSGTAGGLKKNVRRSRGFTLLEVMVALAVVSTALITLLSLGTRSIEVNGRLQRITEATLLAQHRMSEVEVLVREKDSSYQDEEGDFEAPFGHYRWEATFEETPLTSVQMVTITVLWGEQSRNEMVELTSFIFK